MRVEVRVMLMIRVRVKVRRRIVFRVRVMHRISMMVLIRATDVAKQIPTLTLPSYRL